VTVAVDGWQLDKVAVVGWQWRKVAVVGWQCDSGSGRVSAV
jgi:hypothetical protein